MFDFLKCLRPEARPTATAVAAALGAGLHRHAAMPAGVRAEDALVAPFQIDGDPAPGRPAAGSPAPAAPRDVFVVPGGLGLPAVALVNLRDPQPRIEWWALDGPAPTGASTFARRVEPRWPPGDPAQGWQVSQVVALPRLQGLVALRRDADPRTARLLVLDLARGTLRDLGRAQPDPFVHAPVHIAALRVAADAVAVRWHEGRIRLGRWGDVAAMARVVLFTPLERDGLELLRLSLDDGNILGWGLAGTTLWLDAVDGRLRPVPRRHVWSLELSQAL